MPLITLCGFPCVGKSKFAALLASYIEQSSDLQMKCVVINEESLHMSKPDHYKSAAQEKILRQNLKSAVEHVLNAETVVILDSCNYIKGYRYELYCIARSQRTPHCVVHVSVENAISNQWNENNGKSLMYDQTLLEDLRRRFEAPNESNRWDKPLFRVNMMATVQPSAPPTATATAGNSVANVDKDVEASFKNEVSLDITGSEGQKVHAVAKEGSLNLSTPAAQELVLKSGLPPPPGATAVASSWKSSKAKAKLQTDDASVSTKHTSTSSSCFIKKATTNSNVYFSGNRAVDEVVLTDDGPAAVIRNICSYFHTAEAPQPNAATNTVRHSNAQLLYQIDKTSQTITQNIVLHQQKQSLGTPLVFKEFNSFALSLPRHVSMAELQRHRRQYLKVNSQHPPDTAEDIGKHFLEFLSNQI